jgi:hypothetical protein
VLFCGWFGGAGGVVDWRAAELGLVPLLPWLLLLLFLQVVWFWLWVLLRLWQLCLQKLRFYHGCCFSTCTRGCV